MAEVKIAQASWPAGHPEPGDQTGKEVNISTVTKGFTEAYRFNGDNETKMKVVKAAIAITNSHLVGYSNTATKGQSRNDFYTDMESCGWDVNKFLQNKKQTCADCTSYVYTLWCIYCPELRKWFEAARAKGSGNCAAPGSVNSAFVNISKCFTACSLTDPQPGDVVNRQPVPPPAGTGHGHTALVVSVDGNVDITASDFNVGSSGFGASTGPMPQIISGPPIGRTDQVHIPNVDNKVYELQSAIKKTNMMELSSQRKSDFNALRNSMINNSPKMGRSIYKTAELYDSNILKGDQESRKEKF